MIDRRAFRIAASCILVMLAGAFWRIGLRWPAIGNVPYLFVFPLCLTFVTFSLRMEQGRNPASAQTTRRWQVWGGSLLVPYSIIVTMAQTFDIVVSLGYKPLINEDIVGRLVIGLIGLLVATLGNGLPKLPPLQPRYGIDRGLVPAFGTKLLRFRGRVLVAIGICFVGAAIGASPAWLMRLVFGSTLLGVLAMLVRIAQLRRQQKMI